MTDSKPTPPPAGAKGSDAIKFRRDASQGILYVGIDLGTSHTASSASNGTRAVFESVVGYPKDVVSKKLLKQDVLYGEDALKNRLALKMYRPLEKGAIKYSDDAAGAHADDIEGNLEAARALVKRAVELANPRPGELVYGV